MHSVDPRALGLVCSMLMREHRMGFGVLLKEAFMTLKGRIPGTQKGMQDTRGERG